MIFDSDGSPVDKRLNSLTLTAESEIEQALLWLQLEKWRAEPPDLTAVARQTLDALLQGRGQTARELGRHFKMSAGSMNNRLADLVRKGLLARRKVCRPKGGAVFIYEPTFSPVQGEVGEEFEAQS